MILRGREQKTFLSLPQSTQPARVFSRGRKAALTARALPRLALQEESDQRRPATAWGSRGALPGGGGAFRALQLANRPLASLTGVQRGEPGAREGSPAASATGHDQRLHLPDQLGHAVPEALGAAALQLALYLQVGAVCALRSHLRAGAVMEGAAKKWRPGRGRRPGWGAHAGGVEEGADGVRGPGGSGGPGGDGRAAAAAALIAPPGASGLGLRLRGPDASRSSLRLSCNCLCRCCLRRCCSCCHSPRPGPGRLQLRARPWPPLHPREGVARLRGAGRAGGQRGHSSQAREGRSRPPRRQPPAARAADSAFTLMLGGVPAPGGRPAARPLPNPWRLLAWETPAPTFRLCVRTPSPLLPPTRHKSEERPAGRESPTPRASLPGNPPPPRGSCPAPCGERAGLARHPRGTREQTGGLESLDSRDVST